MCNLEEQNYVIESVESASITLVVEGEAKSPSHGLLLKKGSVLFITAGESVVIERASNQNLLMFRAYCHV